MAAWLVPTQLVRVQILGGVPFERTFARKMGSSSNRKTPVSQAGDPGAIPGGSTQQNSPVVQRQRRLVHIQETMVRFHPGLLQRRDAQIRQSAERSGSGTDRRLVAGRLQGRVLLWVLTTQTAR